MLETIYCENGSSFWRGCKPVGDALLFRGKAVGEDGAKKVQDCHPKEAAPAYFTIIFCEKGSCIGKGILGEDTPMIAAKGRCLGVIMIRPGATCPERSRTLESFALGVGVGLPDYPFHVSIFMCWTVARVCMDERVRLIDETDGFSNPDDF